MRMLESRRGVFLAWAKHARACRKAREMVRSREASSRLRVFSAWKEDAHRSRRVREFVIRYDTSLQSVVLSARCWSFVLDMLGACFSVYVFCGCFGVCRPGRV